MQSEPPRALRRGPSWFQRALEERDIWNLANRPLRGLGTIFTRTRRGIGINALARGGGGGAAAPTPWQITVAESPSGSKQFYASVRPGSVSSLVPANIFDRFLLTQGTNYIKLRCATDGKVPNLITVFATTNAAEEVDVVAENTAPPVFYDVLGIVVQTVGANASYSNTVYQIRSSNLTATPAIDMLVSQTPVNPGDEPFVRWWRWELA